MLRVFTDFNARTEAGACWNLVHDGADLGGDVVATGDRIILFQDEDGFEVEAILDFRFVEELRPCAWIATPDWSTRRPTAGVDALGVPGE
jgi:hypothetical protein